MIAPCASCSESLTVADDQIGQTVRCPACEALMQVQHAGAVTDQMLGCPGCGTKLVIADGQNSGMFRCPKCGQHMASPYAVATQEGGRWRDTSADASAGGGLGFNVSSGLSEMEFDSGGARPDRPVKSASSRWKAKTAYSEKVGSVVPGAMLTALVGLGLFLNAAVFFYAMGITDPERPSEPEVRLKKRIMLAWSAGGGLYLGVIMIGAIQMVMRQNLWMGRTACILAVLPSAMFAFAGWTPGFILYPPLAILGIWGLVVLFGRQTRPMAGG